MDWKRVAVVGMVALVVAVVAGCSSIRGYKVVEPNFWGSYRRNVGGLPIAVSTPNKAVFIVKVRRVKLTAVVLKADGTTSTRDLGERLDTSINDKPILLGPTEVYTIDVRRPGAGKLDFSLELDDQYPTKITGKYEDTTITEIKSLITELVEKVASSGITKGVQLESGEELHEVVVSETIKLVIFDLNDGTIKVEDFGGK